MLDIHEDKLQSLMTNIAQLLLENSSCTPLSVLTRIRAHCPPRSRCLQTRPSASVDVRAAQTAVSCDTHLLSAELVAVAHLLSAQLVAVAVAGLRGDLVGSVSQPHPFSRLAMRLGTLRGDRPTESCQFSDTHRCIHAHSVQHTNTRIHWII